MAARKTAQKGPETREIARKPEAAGYAETTAPLAKTRPEANGSTAIPRNSLRGLWLRHTDAATTNATDAVRYLTQ